MDWNVIYVLFFYSLERIQKEKIKTITIRNNYDIVFFSSWYKYNLTQWKFWLGEIHVYGWKDSIHLWELMILYVFQYRFSEIRFSNKIRMVCEIEANKDNSHIAEWLKSDNVDNANLFRIQCEAVYFFLFWTRMNAICVNDLIHMSPKDR